MKKKTVFSLLMAVCLAFGFCVSVEAQQSKLSFFDSTVSAITVQSQNYTYQNVYVVVQNVSFGAGSMYAMPSTGGNDSLSVSVSYSLYASKNAYDTNKQLLTSASKTYKVLNDNALFTGLKNKVYAKLLE